MDVPQIPNGQSKALSRLKVAGFFAREASGVLPPPLNIAFELLDSLVITRRVGFPPVRVGLSLANNAHRI